MSATSERNPRLIVISDGPLRGRAYALRQGNQVLGRVDDADVAIRSPGVSGQHAYVAWDGRQAVITDAGSTNGTTVNGRGVQRLGEQVTLRPGDILGLGDVELRFEVLEAESTRELSRARSSAGWYNELGPNYGTINQAGRDVHAPSWHEHRHGPDDPMDELFQGQGLGRLLMAVGLVVAIAGFALWMYLIFSGGASIDDPSASDPFQKEILGLPAAILGFGAFAGGGLMAGLGGSMSRAARQRERDRHRAMASRSGARW